MKCDFQHLPVQKHSMSTMRGCDFTLQVLNKLPWWSWAWANCGPSGFVEARAWVSICVQDCTLYGRDIRWTNPMDIMVSSTNDVLSPMIQTRADSITHHGDRGPWCLIIWFWFPSSVFLEAASWCHHKCAKSRFTANWLALQRLIWA